MKKKKNAEKNERKNAEKNEKKKKKERKKSIYSLKKAIVKISEI